MPIQSMQKRIVYQPLSSTVGGFEQVQYSSPLRSEVKNKPSNYHENSVQMQNIGNVRYADVTKNALDKNMVTATSMGFLSEQDTVLAKENLHPNSVYMQNVRNVRYANLTKNALDKNTVPATSMGFLSEQDTGLAKGSCPQNSCRVQNIVDYKPLNIDQVRSKCQELSESKKEDGDIVVSLKVLKRNAITGNYKEYQIKRALDENNTISGLVFYERNEIIDGYKNNGEKLYSGTIKSDSGNELNDEDFILDINLVEISKSNNCSDLSSASTPTNASKKYSQHDEFKDLKGKPKKMLGLVIVV